MAQPLSLDAIADEMRTRQTNPNAASSSKMVWDAEQGMFVKLGANENPTSSQTPMNTLSKEPYFV